MFVLSQLNKQIHKWEIIFLLQCLFASYSFSELVTKTHLTLSCLTWREQQQMLLVPLLSSLTFLPAQLPVASIWLCFSAWGLSLRLPAAKARVCAQQCQRITGSQGQHSGEDWQASVCKHQLPCPPGGVWSSVRLAGSQRPQPGWALVACSSSQAQCSWLCYPLSSHFPSFLLVSPSSSKSGGTLKTLAQDL